MFAKAQRSTSPFPQRRPQSPSPSTTTTPPPPSRLSGDRLIATPPSTRSSSDRPTTSSSERPSYTIMPKENVTVTVRFRPLSQRELKKGDETAWYADGDSTVRNESNTSISYIYDRVFGPATTTRHVYDVAAHHVISGAMDGINGTVFAYGVTGSGKTHTMHGVQKSPGIIPLAVKDVFEIIQETPGREFLLRVSYLEIYNEVINDLLDSRGQNLRIREDTQGIYIEGIKEEVVLSPAHALSLIATGEEHRHVGSNNYNLLSSRSHTIFTLTIESSPSGQSQGEEDITLSQLHLIDLAGSESAKTETNGLRRKEGSYINKSLLTLGTVISKLTDGKATHIPYRDSKLTRLLQSSLSGHGRISLICTVTPASSNSEETHNTLKFAQRSKRVEMKASQNKILDEKSLIKKYHKEISNLKQELQKLKHDETEDPSMDVSTQEDSVNAKLQSKREDEEEQAKAALMARIQRLTKLILVSTKTTTSKNIPGKVIYKRGQSFGEDELAYLPDKQREYVTEDDYDNVSLDSEVVIEGCTNTTNLDEMVKDYRKTKRKGVLSWFKSRKPEQINRLSPGSDHQTSDSVYPVSSSTPSQHKVMVSDVKDRQRKSVSGKGDCPVVNLYPEINQADELFDAGSLELPTDATVSDKLDFLIEQVKLLAEEIALSMSSIERLSVQSAGSPEDSKIEEHIQKLKNNIGDKKLHIYQLEQCIFGSLKEAAQTPSFLEMLQALVKVATQMKERTLELEIKSADNRILEEQLQMKIAENSKMQEKILLQSQLPIPDSAALNTVIIKSTERKEGKESPLGATTPTSIICSNGILSPDNSNSLVLQTAEVENLKQENVKLAEEKDGLEIQSHKLAEEAAYAKELAAAAAVELQNLTDEVTKLSYQNAKLINELNTVKETQCKPGFCQHMPKDKQRSNIHAGRDDADSRKLEIEQLVGDLQNELEVKLNREAELEAALSEKEQVEHDLQRKLDEAKSREEDLENDMAHLWDLLASMRDSGIKPGDVFPNSLGTVKRKGKITNGVSAAKSVSSGRAELNRIADKPSMPEELRASYLEEKRRCQELESLISRFKGENLTGLDLATLEELQNLHVEAITKICQAKYANHLL